MKNILLFFFSTMPCYSQCPCVQSAVIGTNKQASIAHNNLVVAMDDLSIKAGEGIRLYTKQSSGESIWYSQGKRMDETFVRPYKTTTYTVKSVLEACPDAYDMVVITVDEAATATSIQVFPNPTSNRLTIVAVGNFISRVKFYDVQGREVLQYTYTGLNLQQLVDVTPLRAGIYLLQVLMVGGEEQWIKIIKN